MPHSAFSIWPAGQTVVHGPQTALLVYVADALVNWPPAQVFTLMQTRSEVAVGWAISYETLMVHSGEVALQVRSDDTVGGTVS